jgi:hypothetical protein
MANKKCNKCNTIKKGKVQERILKNKEKILIELEKSMGIVTSACIKTGITSKTFYVWLKEDEEFARKVDELEWGQRAYVEGKLLKKIASDDTASIIFYLKCNHPKYKTKSEIDVTDSKKLEEMRNDYDGLIKKLKAKRNAKSNIAENTG